jgi:ribonuclease BN (tRNA processing enzyme)
MRLTVLGSGTNVHPTRAAAGYLIETDQTFLLDFGPRTLMNLMKTGVDRHRITHVLFSHFHADHFSDFITFFFDAMYQSKFVGPRPDLTIIGPPGTKKLIGMMLRHFPGFRGARFATTVRELADRSFRIGRTKVTARTVAHSPRLHCLGYRIEHRGKVAAYSGDSMYCRGLIQLCHGADAAVLDCSFPADQPGPNHMHAGDCGRLARDAEVRHAILSHFYPPADRAKVRSQAGRFYDGPITRARDLLTVEL